MFSGREQPYIFIMVRSFFHNHILQQFDDVGDSRIRPLRIKLSNSRLFKVSPITQCHILTTCMSVSLNKRYYRQRLWSEWSVALLCLLLYAPCPLTVFWFWPPMSCSKEIDWDSPAGLEWKTKAAALLDKASKRLQHYTCDRFHVFRGTLETSLFSLRILLSLPSFVHYVLSWYVRKDPSCTNHGNVPFCQRQEIFSAILFGRNGYRYSLADCILPAQLQF